MIFDVCREPLVPRVVTRPLGHGPRQHHAVELNPEVVVQSRRPVLLDDEAEHPDTFGTAIGRLAGDREIAFRLVGSEFFRGHGYAGC